MYGQASIGHQPPIPHPLPPIPQPHPRASGGGAGGGGGGGGEEATWQDASRQDATRTPPALPSRCVQAGAVGGAGGLHGDAGGRLEGGAGGTTAGDEVTPLFTCFMPPQHRVYHIVNAQ